MDVIGAGLGRTGTLSLKVALEMLGVGPCAHMLPLRDEPERSSLFTQAAAGDEAALDKALEGYRSTVDWPGCFFWEQLIEKFPEAPVILTVRDPEKWYASAERTIWAAFCAPPPPGGLPPTMATFKAMADATNWQGMFHGRFADREYAIRVFEEHNAAVRKAVPADRLLEYTVGSGWKPLCDFLGKPVPDEEFPRLNDTAAFQERIGLRRQ
ncbi:MAG TPA: sulfotransferase [Actinoplanes sp.]|jgi:hypothetical protein|nr:sulfotransferase [Actinoplanes sp.]